jgi:hypothetical protein
VLPSVIEPLPVIAAAKAQESAPDRAWLWLNFASLDAPLVALLWQLLLERCLGLASSLETSAALAVSVWFIYVSDRLLDALRGRSDALAPRHEFYRRHWHAFAAAAMIGLFVLGWLCARIHPFLLRNGFILLGGVIFYFVVVHLGPARLRKLWPKEVVVGLIFSLGTCLPAWTEKADGRRDIWAPALLFAALCVLNCMAIEWWEWFHYRPAFGIPPHRFTRWVGSRLASTTALVAVLSAACVATGPEAMHPFYLASFLSCAALFCLAWQSDRVPVELLRVLADVALLTPAVVTAFAAVR